MPFSIRKHIYECIIPCIIVSITSFVIPTPIYYFMDDSIIRFFIVVPVAILSTLCCCYMFGLSSSEKLFFSKKAKQIIFKIFLRKACQ